MEAISHANRVILKLETPPRGGNDRLVQQVPFGGGQRRELIAADFEDLGFAVEDMQPAPLVAQGLLLRLCRRWRHEVANLQAPIDAEVPGQRRRVEGRVEAKGRVVRSRHRIFVLNERHAFMPGH